MHASIDELIDFPEKFEGEKISIKGFLVSDSEGHFFLTSHPYVRSCCIHHVKRVPVVGAELTADFKAQEIHAVFTSGRLEHAISEKSDLHLMPWTVFSFLGLLFFQYYFRNFWKKNSP